MNDGLDLLTGDSVADLLGAALAPAGGELEDWRAAEVDHQPGGATKVSYPVRVRWPGGAVTREIIGAVAGDIPVGAARLSDGSTEVGVWRFPHDPMLPALPGACDPARLAALLGVRPSGLRLRSYRPCRRAVIEATTARGPVFVKVVRPPKVDDLYRRHRVALDAGCPVPGPLGWSSDGLLALAGLPGTTLRSRLAAGAVPDLPGAGSFTAVLDTLPPQLATGAASSTWGQRAPHYADVLAGVLPEVGGRARAVAAAVDHTAPEEAAMVVHGDFYENQLMVNGGSISGVLDIDTIGSGERLDDLGCLLAHLSVLAQLWPQRVAVIDRLGRQLHRAFAREHDAAALARRAAAVALSLATGPHRVQEPQWAGNTVDRIALAERWLDDPGGVWAAGERAFICDLRSAS